MLGRLRDQRNRLYAGRSSADQTDAAAGKIDAVGGPVRGVIGVASSGNVACRVAKTALLAYEQADDASPSELLKSLRSIVAGSNKLRATSF